MAVEGPKLQCKTPKPVSLDVPAQHFWDAHVPRNVLLPCATPSSKLIPISSLLKYKDLEASLFHYFSFISVFSRKRMLQACLVDINRIKPFRKCCCGHFLLKWCAAGVYAANQSPQPGATKYDSLLSLMGFKPTITQGSALTNWL